MGFWTFMALLAILYLPLAAYRLYLRSRPPTDGEVAKLQARVEALEGERNLEARVRTLEAIVTDPKTRLHAAIDHLDQA